MDEADEPGHVFISYAHENSTEVGRLQLMLESADIPVWRDKANLWPGDDWRAVIRREIRDNTLVFIACFSAESVGRARGFHNEELALAIEEMRSRPLGRSWLIPVRFSECTLPDIEIGPGRTLDSLHRADLFGLSAADNAERLVAAVRRILGQDCAGPTYAYSLREQRGSPVQLPLQAIARRRLRWALIGITLIVAITIASYTAFIADDTGNHAGSRSPGNRPKILAPQPPVVYSVAFSPAGTKLAAGDADGNTYIWKVATRKTVMDLPDSGNQAVESVAFASSGTFLASGNVDGYTTLWNLGTGKVYTLGDARSQGVASVSFSPNGNTLATGDMNGSIYLWHLSAGAGKIITTLPDPTGKSAGSVAYSPAGGNLAAGDYNGCVYVWNVAEQKVAASLCPRGSGGILSVAISRNGTRLAAGDVNGSIYVWDLTTLERTAIFHSQRRQLVPSVAFSPSGKELAAGDYLGRIYVWDLARHRITATFRGPVGREIESVTFGPGGTRLATGDQDGSIYLWTLRSPAGIEDKHRFTTDS
jgi:hypothetical protein